jgi:shikimate kinase
MARIVVLVGMMGSGKTTVGRQVASRLGMRFVDTDDLVEARAGKTVRDIFATDGEAAFRDHESNVLIGTLESSDDVLIAAAGGVVLAESNRTAISAHAAAVLWLDADVATLGERVSRGAHRPLLDDDPVLRLSGMDAQRRELYRSVAHERVDTSDKGVTEVVDEVVAVLSKRHLVTRLSLGDG